MKRIALFAIVGCVIIGGTIGMYSFLQDNNNRGQAPSPYAHVTYSGDITWNGSFSMDGELYLVQEKANISTFRNISVVTSSTDNQTLDVECLGRLTYPDRLEVTIQLSERPQWVAFNSPHFWDSNVSDFTVEIYQWNGNEYVERTPIAAPSEFPMDGTIAPVCS